MKKLIIFASALLLGIAAQARIALSLEAGAGTTTTGSAFRYYTLPGSWQTANAERVLKPVLGITISHSKSKLFYGIGVRYWQAVSEYSVSLPGSPFIGTLQATNTLTNVSVPLHIGLHLPLRKLFAEGKVKLGPSFISHELESTYGPFSNTSNSLVSSPVGLVGGLDVGIGGRVLPRMQLQLKYSFMGYLSEVSYDALPVSTLGYKAELKSGRPNMSALMLEASFRL